LNNLVLDFFKLVNEYTLKEEAFIMIKEQLKNNLFNFQKENAVFKLKSEFYQLMLKSFYLESELFTALDNLSFYEYN
jgi:secreted Zn-dependent insulinase-like peptidase